jgi:replicative DNA helicase
MQLIEQYDSIDIILEAAISAREEQEKERKLMKRLQEYYEKIYDTKKTRDFIIKEMLCRLVQIHQNKAMGRSKHARDLRQSIENTIKELPNRRALIVRWFAFIPELHDFVPQLLDKFDQEELEAQQPQKQAVAG